jgi:XTP/dITP diphosphohydrolase
MMHQILVASGNENKIEEMRAILKTKFEVLGLNDINWTEEIPEPFDTIRENAIHKAHYFFEKTGKACFSEDSGLEVDALDGKPSAFSARFAGPEKNDLANIHKVLELMQGVENRKAQFKSVMVFYDGSQEIITEGVMRGTIIHEIKGENGFGYDPIFIADNQTLTNAQLTKAQKNEISHRRKALNKMIAALG